MGIGEQIRYKDHGCDAGGIFVRLEGALQLLLNTSWDPRGPLLQFAHSDAPLPARFRMSPIVTPHTVEVDAAALKLVAAVDPAEAKALEQAPWEQVYIYGGYAGNAQVARTAHALRIRFAYHEFDSGDMVRMDHDRTWVVLAEPLIVVCAYIGDRGKGVRVCSEPPVPEEAVAVFLKSVGA
jgi:hypothetical protein